jgi:imidazoleglycerol-phosphate dehydratase
MRTARIERKTKESHVLVELNLDGEGVISVDTVSTLVLISR